MQYRLIEITYKNRIEWEDGPGSLQNIVSDVIQKKVLVTWSKERPTVRKPDADGYYFFPRSYFDDDPTGWYEFGYRVECRADDTSEWQFEGLARPLARDDSEE
jgi:hypothetical protein